MNPFIKNEDKNMKYTETELKMDKYTQTEINEIKNKFIERIDKLTGKEFGDLSISEMAWLKCVAVSSIMAMKKKGYSNTYIMTTHQHEKQTPVQKASKVISTLTDEQLAELGLTRM